MDSNLGDKGPHPVDPHLCNVDMVPMDVSQWTYTYVIKALNQVYSHLCDVNVWPVKVSQWTQTYMMNVLNQWTHTYVMWMWVLWR